MLHRDGFQFLLDREPKESILRHFEVTVISHYFPEVERDICVAIGQALTAFTPQECANYFKNAGYAPAKIHPASSCCERELRTCSLPYAPRRPLMRGASTGVLSSLHVREPGREASLRSFPDRGYFRYTIVTAVPSVVTLPETGRSLELFGADFSSATYHVPGSRVN